MRYSKSDRFINRNFALVWAGQGISVLGDFIFDTTLVLWIGTVIAQGQAWAPLAVGGVLLVATAPALIIGPFVGVFVDRWDKRRVMLWMDGGRALLLLLLWLLVSVAPLLGIRFSPVFLVGMLYLAVGLASVCAQLFEPAQLALIGDIVPEPQRARATGLSQLVANAGYVVGPVIASQLFVWLGAQCSIIMDALSFVISFCTVIAIAAPPVVPSSARKEQASFLREFVQGLHFSASNRVLVTLIIMGVLFMVSAGVINTLYLFFITGNVHVAANLYGLFVAAPGLGGVIGALLTSRRSRQATRGGLVRLLWLSSLCWGIVVVLLACQCNSIVALCLVFLIGVLNACIGVASTPLLLLVTPRELVGRVFATRRSLLSLASLISIFGAGYLSSQVLLHMWMPVFDIELGPISLLFLCAGLLVLASGGYAWLTLRAGSVATAPAIPDDAPAHGHDRMH